MNMMGFSCTVLVDMIYNLFYCFCFQIVNFWSIKMFENVEMKLPRNAFSLVKLNETDFPNIVRIIDRKTISWNAGGSRCEIHFKCETRNQFLFDELGVIRIKATNWFDSWSLWFPWFIEILFCFWKNEIDRQTNWKLKLEMKMIFTEASTNAVTVEFKVVSFVIGLITGLQSSMLKKRVEFLGAIYWSRGHCCDQMNPDSSRWNSWSTRCDHVYRIDDCIRYPSTLSIGVAILIFQIRHEFLLFMFLNG